MMRKILWGICLIILCQVLLVIFSRLSPLTIFFHKALFQSLQLLIICWLVFAIALDIIFWKRKRVRSGLISLIMVVTIVAAGELLSVKWLQNPQQIPATMLDGYRLYYQHNHRKVIQIVPECSQYDSGYFYDLKPNITCTYSNIEFSNKFITNTRGMRDDNSSLYKPQIICLGDSYIMGWGVEQDQTIPSVLETITAKKALNAGMSSFGTVREMMRLATLDTSAVEYIIIQYCANDNEENKSYFDNNKVLKISSRESYDSLMIRDRWNKKYFPGKYFLVSLSHLLKEKTKATLGRPPSIIGLPNDYPRDAKMFLDILLTSPVNFNRTKVIVFSTDRDNEFLKEIKKLQTQSNYAEHFGNQLILADMSKVLNEEDDFFLLDEHYTAKAHKKIAEKLAEYIR